MTALVTAASGSHLALLGVALVFLAGCIFAVPLASKWLHEKMLRGLQLDGATIVRHPWALSALSIRRPDWDGEVRFEPAGIGGGHPGHLLLRARFTALKEPSTPAGGGAAPAAAPIRTGDGAFDQAIVVTGDRGFAERLLVPEIRERLLELDRMGGQVIALESGALEIRGPLLSRPEDLRHFLELCEAIVRRAILAAAG